MLLSVQRVVFLIATLVVVISAAAFYPKQYGPNHLSDEDYYNEINTILNAYRGDMDWHSPDADPLEPTKYHALKRNADLIHAILGLPKKMIDVGR